MDLDARVANHLNVVLQTWMVKSYFQPGESGRVFRLCLYLGECGAILRSESNRTQ